jgi:hypothetical protein
MHCGFELIHAGLFQLLTISLIFPGAAALNKYPVQHW